MTTLQTLADSQVSKEIPVNENFDTLSASGIYGKKHPTTSGLTWGYYGGFYNGNTIADGTVALTNATDNYVVVLRSTGVVSTSTSSTNSLDPLYAKLYKLTTAGSVVTVVADQRWDANGLLFNTSGVGGTVTSVAASVPSFLSVAGSPITTSGTLAISYSGTALPVANGGTGITSLGAGVATFLGTPSSANLAAAVTDETGSGALVFATSPTLVTPALGTPSALVLTNATGLPVAGGGTGVASLTAYAPVFGGTTSTAAVQSGTAGTSGQVLTSNGAGVLPTFQAAASGSVATDTIWDAAGDLVYGTGANTAVRLAPGTGLQQLRMNAGATAPEWFTDSGGAGTKTYAVFTPMTSQPPASNFATLDTRNSIAVLDFDDTTEESIFWVGVMPEAASLGSGLIVNIFFMATTATTGDARFGAQFERMNTDEDADSFDTATEATVATSGTSGIVTKLAITCTTIDSIAAGEAYRLKIYRDTTGADTITGDVEVVAVELRSAA